MKKFSSIIFWIFFWPFLLIFKLFPKKSYFFFRKMLKCYGNNNDCYITFREWPKKPSTFYIKEFLKRKNNDCILVQGPPVLQDDFTYETLKMYVNECNCKIYYSTWNDLNSELKERIEKLGVKVILSEKPKNNGFLNINYQITSCLNGLNTIKKDGFSYCLKTRSDQRLYKLQFMTYFESLLEQFGDDRIISMNYNYCNLGWPYYISDFLFYGKIDNLISLYSVDLSIENFKERIDISIKTEDVYKYLDDNKEMSRYDLSKDNLAPEIIFTKNYLYKKGYTFDYSANTNLNIMSKYYISISQDDVGFYWKKYDYTSLCSNHSDGLYLKNDSESTNFGFNQTFVNWFINYSDGFDINSITEYNVPNIKYWRK